MSKDSQIKINPINPVQGRVWDMYTLHTLVQSQSAFNLMYRVCLSAWAWLVQCMQELLSIYWIIGTRQNRNLRQNEKQILTPYFRPLPKCVSKVRNILFVRYFVVNAPVLEKPWQPNRRAHQPNWQQCNGQVKVENFRHDAFTNITLLNWVTSTSEIRPIRII